ncbi:N-methyl-D-aspartate receptor-associated protein [Carabus blaptoides fortunei]
MDAKVSAAIEPPPYTEADAKEHQEKLKKTQQIENNDQMQQNDPKQAETWLENGKPDSQPENIIVLDEDDLEKLQIILAFSEKTVRRAFARKVFAILTILLLKTFSFIALCVYCEPVRKFWADNIVTILFAMPVYLIAAFTIICVKSARRTYPWNYIILFAFSSSLSYMIGGLSSFYSGTTIMIAFGMTAVLVASLVIFACQTRWDFTGWRMFGFSSGILLLLIVVSSLSCLSRAGEIWLAGLGIFVFSMLLIYDVQLIISGTHKYKISPEEHIFAVTILYLDIMNIFLYILRAIR